MSTTIAPSSAQALSPGLQAGLQERLDSIDTAQHDHIVSRLIDCYRACKADQKAAPAPYQPGGEWSHYLAERQTFYDALLTGDASVVGDKLRNFWRNELGPIVKEYARYDQIVNGEQESIERFTNNVTRNHDTWTEIFRCDNAVLEVPRVGNPWGLVINEQLVVPKATRYHALATQIGELLRDVQAPLIAEIGAGYAGQAYYLLRDQPSAKYVDFDLPETMIIAAYYLLATCPERNIYLYGESSQPLPEIISEHDACVLPNFALPKLGDAGVDLFFNSFSFSEMPRETLGEYLQQVTRSTKTYLLHNNMDRQGVVNRGFERIPASTYPIPRDAWKCVYKKFDLFHGHAGDYREFLYQRIGSC